MDEIDHKILCAYVILLIIIMGAYSAVTDHTIKTQCTPIVINESDTNDKRR